CGGVAGITLAFGLIRALLNLLPLEIPRMQAASVDGGVLVFVLVISVVTGLLFGAFPALRSSRSAPARALGEGSRTVSSGKAQHRLHNGLVVAQTAICMVLLIGSGLLMRSFVRILTVDPGFDAKNVLTRIVRSAESRSALSFLPATPYTYFGTAGRAVGISGVAIAY